MLASRKKAPENDGNYRFWYCGFTSSNPDKAVQKLLSFADQTSDLRLLSTSGRSKNDEEGWKFSSDKHLLSSWSDGCTDFKKCLSVFLRTNKEKPRTLTRRGITDGNLKHQLETSVIKLHKMYPFQHFDDPAKHMEVYRNLITYPRLKKVERTDAIQLPKISNSIFCVSPKQGRSAPVSIPKSPSEFILPKITQDFLTKAKPSADCRSNPEVDFYGKESRCIPKKLCLSLHVHPGEMKSNAKTKSTLKPLKNLERREKMKKSEEKINEECGTRIDKFLVIRALNSQR